MKIKKQRIITKKFANSTWKVYLEMNVIAIRKIGITDSIIYHELDIGSISFQCPDNEWKED